MKKNLEALAQGKLDSSDGMSRSMPSVLEGIMAVVKSNIVRFLARQYWSVDYQG